MNSSASPLLILISVLCTLLIMLVGYVAVSNNTQARRSQKQLDALEAWNNRQDLAIQSVQIWQDNHTQHTHSITRTPRPRPG